MKERRARQQGFSLLEILVAFSIMAFSLAALYQASGGSVRTLGDMDSHQKAALLAQSLLDARDTVPDSGWNETGESAGLHWRVSSAPYPTNVTDPKAVPLHRVQITIGWT